MVKDRHSELSESAFLWQNPSLQRRNKVPGSIKREKMLEAWRKKEEIKKLCSEISDLLNKKLNIKLSVPPNALGKVLFEAKRDHINLLMTDYDESNPELLKLQAKYLEIIKSFWKSPRKSKKRV
jgi:hypothetical protein